MASGHEQVDTQSAPLILKVSSRKSVIHFRFVYIYEIV